MPAADSTTESGSGLPLAESHPPPLGDELAQPGPTVPAFPHGQGVDSEPSPKQNGVIEPVFTTSDPVGSVPADPNVQFAGSWIATSHSSFVPLDSAPVLKAM